MSDDVAAVAAKYFKSWRVKDFDTFRSQVADDVTSTVQWDTPGTQTNVSKESRACQEW